MAVAQPTTQAQQLARRSVEEQLAELHAEVMHLREGEAVQCAEQPARAVQDKDKELAGMRVSQFVKGIVDKAYTCPCCNKMIPDVAPKKIKNELREFARLHAAERYLKSPLLHVGAKLKIPDLLHINLRITAGLYYYTVQRHCATPEDLQALRQWMFDELGITVKSKKRQNKEQDALSIGQKKESFIIGAECVKLFALYDKALEHVRETYPTVSASDDVKAQTAWETCKQL
eukprot:jgi/Tetstr1/423041/TSEL_013812.t1